MLDDIADLAAARRDRGHGGDMIRLQRMLHAEQKTKTDNTNIFSLPAFRRTHPVEAPVEAAPGFNGLPGGEAWLDRHIGWMRRGVKAASSGTARRRSGPIRMQSMRSSSIEAAGYDRDRQTLRIRYVRGSTYDYVAVPARVFRDFLEADSKGRFVNWSIKPFYRYTRVS